MAPFDGVTAHLGQNLLQFFDLAFSEGRMDKEVCQEVVGLLENRHFATQHEDDLAAVAMLNAFMTPGDGRFHGFFHFFTSVRLGDETI